MIPHEVPDPGVEKLITTDEAQILQQLTGKESDHGSIIRRAGTINQDRVMVLGIEHGFENDLPRFLLGEGLHGQALISQRGRIE